MIAARVLLLLLLWSGVAAAAEPRPFAPPPPDLRHLLPFAAVPLDKPPVPIDLALPPVPVDLPAVAPVAVRLPVAEKPIAVVQPPRSLPCIGAWIGVASESLACGRARFQRAEYEDAAKALDQSVRKGTDRDLLREARYWLGETYYRLGRTEDADWLFRQVAQDSPRQEWGVWSLHSAGWTALLLRDAARARDIFTQLLAGPQPSPLEAWGRHGLGLALYAVGSYAEAEQAWARLGTRGAPPALERDVMFWHGEALGRSGQHAEAAAELTRFTQGGPHPLLALGYLQLGWWSLAAGNPKEAVSAFAAYLALPSALDRDAGQAGLASAQIATGDWAAARKTVTAMQSRRSPLALPVTLRLARAALDAPLIADPDTVTQGLLAGTLTPPVRAWVLLVKGEAGRAAGNRDEARSQFDLARTADPAGPLAAQATFRLARTNFELREFSQAVADLAPLANAKLTPETRLAVLLLEGEAAYHAGDYVVAGPAFGRAITEFPDSAEAPAARLAAAWTAFRRGRNDEARREFVEFARLAPVHPNAADALVLAAELALGAGDIEGARTLLERTIANYPSHPRTDVARLNRAILMVRAGQHVEARAALTDWLSRAPYPALFGRAHAALGVAWLAGGRPSEAAHEFGKAQKEGIGAIASLGAGVTAMTQSAWDDAARALTEARDAGTPDVAAEAEYGLAVVAFHRGAVRDFKKPALAALDGAGAEPARAGALLYALTGIAVEEKDWPAAFGYARRLVTEHPAHEAADDGLERVGAGAVAATAWPVVYDAYALLRQKYPQSPFAAGARFYLAQAALETGRAATARTEMEQFLAASPADPRAPQALIMLARAREQVGDRAGALEAYSRAARESSGPEWSRDALFGHARLLMLDKRWDQARAVFERLLKSAEPEVALEAAKGLGDAYAGAGEHLAAAEYYMSAAYLAPDTALGRRSLLGAGKAFAALKQDESAAIVYKKLLALSDVPNDLAESARQGLAALGR